MAARRLIIVLVALMVLSTIAAALAPVREVDEETTTATTTTAEAKPLPDGGSVEAEARAGAARPLEVEAARGDELTLLVKVERPGEVAIAGLGLVEYATPGVPARFDLLLRESGRFAVSLEDGSTVARVSVSPAPSGRDDDTDPGPG